MTEREQVTDYLQYQRSFKLQHRQTKGRRNQMGMYDKERQLKNADFATGEFVLWSGQYLGKVNSAEFGENEKARVSASASEHDASEQFVVYGVLADQISRMEQGDVPAIVRLGKDGRANIFEYVRPVQGVGSTAP